MLFKQQQKSALCPLCDDTTFYFSPRLHLLGFKSLSLFSPFQIKNFHCFLLSKFQAAGFPFHPRFCVSLSKTRWGGGCLWVAGREPDLWHPGLAWEAGFLLRLRTQLIGKTSWAAWGLPFPPRKDLALRAENRESSLSETCPGATTALKRPPAPLTQGGALCLEDWCPPLPCGRLSNCLLLCLSFVF